MPAIGDRKVNWLVLILAIITINQLIDISKNKLYGSYAISEDWGADQILFFIKLFFLPISLYFFWKRDKIGWILIAIFLLFSIGQCINFMLYIYGIYADMSVSGIYGEEVISGSATFMYQSKLLIEFIGIGVYFVSLYLLSRKEVGVLYDLSQEAILIIIGVLSLLFFMYYWSF